jgi:hypothetical protein
MGLREKVTVGVGEAEGEEVVRLRMVVGFWFPPEKKLAAVKPITAAAVAMPRRIRVSVLGKVDKIMGQRGRF